MAHYSRLSKIVIDAPPADLASVAMSLTASDPGTADGRYDFLLSALPLPITGAVGSPINPMALR